MESAEVKPDTETVEQEAANRYTRRRLLDKEDRDKELIKATREEEEGQHKTRLSFGCVREASGAFRGFGFNARAFPQPHIDGERIRCDGWKHLDVLAKHLWLMFPHTPAAAVTLAHRALCEMRTRPGMQKDYLLVKFGSWTFFSKAAKLRRLARL